MPLSPATESLAEWPRDFCIVSHAGHAVMEARLTARATEPGAAGASTVTAAGGRPGQSLISVTSSS